MFGRGGGDDEGGWWCNASMMIMPWGWVTGTSQPEQEEEERHWFVISDSSSDSLSPLVNYHHHSLFSSVSWNRKKIKIKILISEIVKLTIIVRSRRRRADNKGNWRYNSRFWGHFRSFMCHFSDAILSECHKKSNSFWLKTIIVVVSGPQLDPDSHGEIFLQEIIILHWS